MKKCDTKINYKRLCYVVNLAIKSNDLLLFYLEKIY